MPDPLTAIERKIYQFLIDHLKEETFQPSIREIGKRFGIRSTKTVAEHLEALERKGCIARVAARSRGVRILGIDLSPSTYSVRMYRSVRASDLGAGDPDLEGVCELDRGLAGSPDSFLVRVNGADTGCPGVFDGDYLLVEPVEELEDEQWVAVWSGEGVRLARWRAAEGVPSPEGDGVDAGNGLGGEARVLGRVRALVRRFGPTQ